VHGVDISLSYINAARNRCLEAGYDDSKFRFYKMDVHSMGFSNNSFDLAVGLGILHHLDFDVALQEIRRVLKPRGRVLLQEPLADNPMLKIFRRLTPSVRTEGEYPLRGKDILRLRNSADWETETCFCGLIEAPVAMLTSVLMRKSVDNFLLRAADWFERKMHKLSVFDSWNQYVLLNLVKISTD
jgi:SAM-dependent methyltransferase